jgi:hypothetical protein
LNFFRSLGKSLVEPTRSPETKWCWKAKNTIAVGMAARGAEASDHFPVLAKVTL